MELSGSTENEWLRPWEVSWYGLRFWIKWYWTRLGKIVEKERRCNKVPLVPVKKRWGFRKIFVVLSDYMNFNIKFMDSHSYTKFFFHRTKSKKLCFLASQVFFIISKVGHRLFMQVIIFFKFFLKQRGGWDFTLGWNLFWSRIHIYTIYLFLGFFTGNTYQTI